MGLTNANWKNKEGTGSRDCKCGTWKQHWINHSGCVNWPQVCVVVGCSNTATVGAHIINSKETGEWIAPLCDQCNKRTTEFNLEGNIYLAPANQAHTCDKSE